MQVYLYWRYCTYNELSRVLVGSYGGCRGKDDADFVR